MNATLSACPLVVLLLLPVGAQGAGAPLSPAAYRAELDRVLAACDRVEQRPSEVPAIVASLPDTWQIRDGSTVFEISTASLRRDLRELQQRPGARRVLAIRERMLRLRDELDAYQAAPADARPVRARLEQILSRPEFAGIHGPTWIERLKQAALGLVVGLLERMMGSSAIPTIGRVVVYGLAVVAVIVMAVWVYRGFRRAARVESILPEALPVSARGWSLWLADARAAADEGRWRDAVRLAYWAGISFLESTRVWPPDRARTPREYLRLLPVDHEHRPALSALTRTFELAWYARQAADGGTFERAISSLEKLGCRPR
ncbi:MAG TPA: DUF4129 domain-containing protein [Vicinamibacterales bacterium]|jgi:hypothetical protein